MSTETFYNSLIQSNRPIISDGAMGTLLNAHGVSFEACFDNLNLSNPALVGQVHREYIDAGSNMIQTNTFSANRYKLSQHGLENRLREINAAAVEIITKFSGDFGCKGFLLVSRVYSFGQKIMPRLGVSLCSLKDRRQAGFKLSKQFFQAPGCHAGFVAH